MPLTPAEVKDRTIKRIPDAVLDLVDQMLVDLFDGTSAKLDQHALVEAITDSMRVTKQHIYDEHWLDFEPVFRAKGWRVEYHRPAYNEQWAPYWLFIEPPTN